MFLKQRSYIAVKIEETEGMPETLGSNDIFLTYNADFKPSVEMIEREPTRDTLSAFPSTAGKRSATISFETELAGTGNPGDPFPFAAALLACGYKEEIIDGGKRYTPTSVDIPSVTIGLFLDGKLYRIWGARGNVIFTFENGAPARARFEFTGANFDQSDTAFPSVNLQDLNPPIFMGANFSIDLFSAIISRVEIDMGNNIVLRSDVNSPSGNRCAVIQGRKAVATFDPEDVLVADKDFLSMWRDGNLSQMQFTLNGGVGNTVKVFSPAVQFREISLGDRDGITIYEISCLLTGNDDELVFELT